MAVATVRRAVDADVDALVRIQSDTWRTAYAELVPAAAIAELTGPAAVTLAEAAQLLTERTGRAIRYVDETVEEAYASRAAYDAPSWQLDAWVSTYLAIGDGSLGRVTADVEELTGHPARSVREALGL